MEEDKKTSFAGVIDDLINTKTLLWDIDGQVFYSFSRNEAGEPRISVTPESLLPPISKSDLIKKLKSNIEREISIKYLGEETYNKLAPEQKEYETFIALYNNGMRRINNPVKDDEKYYNRLYDRYYKRLLREKKKAEVVKEVVYCPYIFQHNGKRHAKGQVCGAPAKSAYGGFCSKHKVLNT